MKQLLPLLLVATALVGCAADSATKDATAASNGSDVYCERETPTGSMMSKTTCRSAEQRAADRAGVTATAEAIRNQRNLPPGK